MIHLGIDCGSHGAVAYIGPNPGWLSIDDTPRIGTKADPTLMLARLRRGLRDFNPSECFATIEQVHVMPVTGRKAAFSMGKGLGYWEMVVIALDVPYQIVRASVWRRTMHRGVEGGTPREKSLTAALRLFPNQHEALKRKGVLSHDRCEAALIAEYGRRQK